MIQTQRRTLLALIGASALSPTVALSQANGLSPSALTRLASLAGVDPLPRDLVTGLADAMPDEVATLEGLEDDETLPNKTREALLNALYSGVSPGDDARRIGFASALMWAAIENSNNVISYCGGEPGFWAEPPETT